MAEQEMINLVVVLGVFSVGVASPGPATLMIIGVAIQQGRARAIALAMGVVSGSIAWATVAAAGLVGALQASAMLFSALKIAGAIYLLILGIRSFSSAVRERAATAPALPHHKSYGRAYLSGLLLHLTNPKAPLVWAATLSVGASTEGGLTFLTTAIFCCAAIAVFVFIGYAVLFSTETAARIYWAFRRPWETIAGVFFTAAAVRVLTLRHQ